MLRAQLGVRLDVVATIGDNFSDIVDDLIRWAEREGRMADLIRGASWTTSQRPYPGVASSV